MTTALYRRYRPDTFATVIGQDHVTGPLRAALRANRVTHAYLFSGPRGCGKTTSARIMARCLNCEQGPTDTPCGHCDSCRELATGGSGSLDVVEIDAASHGGVDDARELRERATFAPVRDRYKVFIIDEAHMVSREGFNALLKLVEEPPEHVKFIFATTEPERVIGTIRSRTHHYPFRLVPPDVLGPYLTSLAQEEGVHIDPGVLDMVMRSGGGSVRDTLSILDQLVAGSVKGELTYATAVSLLGYTDTHLLDETIDALAAGDGAAAYRVVERTVDSGHDPRRFVEDLLQRLRDLLIIAVAGEAAADVLVSVPSDQFERMRTQAATWGARALSHAADLADAALRQMVGATSPRLQLELLIGRILVPSSVLKAQDTPEVSLPKDSSAQGGSSREGGAVRSFGPKEAREELQRSRAAQMERASAFAVSAAPGASQAQESARGASASLTQPWPSGPENAGHHSPSSAADSSSVSAAKAHTPVADSGWPDVVVSVAGSPSPRDPSFASVQASQPLAQPSVGHSSKEGSSAENSFTQQSFTREQHASQDLGRASDGADSERSLQESPEQPVDDAGKNEGLIHEQWPQILERLAAMSPATGSLLKGCATLGAMSKDALVLVFSNENLARNMERDDRAAKVAEAVYEVTGLRVQVRTSIAQSSDGSTLTATPARTVQETSAPPEEPRPFDRSRSDHAWNAHDQAGNGRDGKDLDQGASGRAEDEEKDVIQSSAWSVSAQSAAVQSRAEDDTEHESESEVFSQAQVPSEEPQGWPTVAPIASSLPSHITEAESNTVEPSQTSESDSAPERLSARPAFSVFSYEEIESRGENESGADLSSRLDDLERHEETDKNDNKGGELPLSPQPSQVAASPSSRDSLPAYSDQVQWPKATPVSLEGWNTAGTSEGVSVSFEDESASSASSQDVASAEVNSQNATIDDTASIDDENIETVTRFGLPVILEILGGTVVDEIYDEGVR